MQGATIIDKYFIYAEITNYSSGSMSCGNKKGRTFGCNVNIYRCNLYGKNCKKIVKNAKLGHANALDHEWGKNCFYVYDGWCNPAKESYCTKGAFDVNGHKASNCGIKAKNRGFKTDKNTTSQGYTSFKVGKDTYFLKGFSGKNGASNRIKVYKNGKHKKTIMVSQSGELEDVMVDCSGKYCIVKYTINGKKQIFGTNYKIKKPTVTGNSSTKKTGKHKNKTSKGNSNSGKSGSNGSGGKSGSNNNHVDYTVVYDDDVDMIFFGTVNGKSACGTFEVANLIIEIMTYGIGVLGAIGITVVGIMYLTAKGNEAQTAKAKKRMREIVIGLVAYAMIWAVMNWLMPGGVFNGECGGPDSSTAKTTVESSDSVSLKK